jgi:hypothetical protein
MPLNRELPSQNSYAGKYLTTDGTSAFWGDIKDKKLDFISNYSAYNMADLSGSAGYAPKVCMATGSYVVTAYFNETTLRIEKKGQQDRIVGIPKKDTNYTISLTEGEVLWGNKPFNLNPSKSNAVIVGDTVPALNKASKTLSFWSNRNYPNVVKLFSPFEDTFVYIHRIASDYVSTTKSTVGSLTLKAGEVYTYIVNDQEGSWVYYFEAESQPIVGFKYGSRVFPNSTVAFETADVITLRPLSKVVYSRTNRYIFSAFLSQVLKGNPYAGFDIEDVFNTANSPFAPNSSYISRFTADSPMQVQQIADGAGGDAEQGIAEGDFGDLYLVDHDLYDYTVFSTEPCTIRIYDSTGLIVGDIDLSKSTYSAPLSYQVGNPNGGDVSNPAAKLPGVAPYRFVGSAPFALRTSYPVNNYADGSAGGKEYWVDGIKLSKSSLVQPYKPANINQAGKNLFLNGDFSCNQTGRTSTTTNLVYVADKWLTRTNSGVVGPGVDGTVTFSLENFPIGTAPIAGFESAKFLRIATTGQAAADSVTLLRHFVEDARTLAGQYGTISFWARAASGSPFITPEIVQTFGTGGTPSPQVFAAPQRLQISTTWQRYSITYFFPSIAGKTIGTDPGSDCLQFSLWTSAAPLYVSRSGVMGIQNNTIDLWGFQLEAGTVTTPFARNAGTTNSEIVAIGSNNFDGVLVSTKRPLSASGHGVNSWAGYNVAGKNLLVNGGMDYWQRSTSSASNGGYFTADRWRQIAAGTTTHSRDTDVPALANVQYSMKWVTSAGSSYGQVYQMIERDTVASLRGQLLTLSAYFKTVGAYAGALILRVDYTTDTDTFTGGTWVNLPNSDNAFAGTTVAAWTRRSTTFTVPANAVGLRVSLIPDTAQASGISVYHTGWQLELGATATQFSRAGGSLGGELALCQRYYQRFNSGSSGYTPMSGFGLANLTTQITLQIQHVVPMRGEVSAIDHSGISLYGGSSGGFASISSVLLTRSSGQFTEIAPQATGLTVGQFFRIQPNNVANSYIGFNAEI